MNLLSAAATFADEIDEGDLQLLICSFLPLSPLGIRTVDTDGHSGDAAGGLGDRSRLHFCHTKAPTDDHL